MLTRKNNLLLKKNVDIFVQKCNMTKEIWKPVVGYEGLYDVSNFGRVKSLKYRKGDKPEILKLQKRGKYLRASLNGRKFSVHRLVAQAFIPNSLNLPEVNHKDEDTHNNFVNNLEWCDRPYNSRYGTKTKRVADANRNGKLSKPVYQYSLDGELIAVFLSAQDVKRKLGYSQGNISNCCIGNRKTAYGYKWSYNKFN